MKKILAVCCLALLGNVGIASSQTAKPRGYDPLLTKLASVRWLSNHDPGFGGSNEFYKLSKEFLESHKPADFKRMLHSRNPIVKAMGLLCLAQVDPDKYWFTLLSHGKDNEEVYLHQGCIVSEGDNRRVPRNGFSAIPIFSMPKRSALRYSAPSNKALQLTAR